MTAKERLHQMIEDLPEVDLQRAEAMLRGLGLPAPPGSRAGPALTPEERRARVKAFRGSAAHLPGSVDDFLRRKHEDTEREEARLRGASAEPEP